MWSVLTVDQNNILFLFIITLAYVKQQVMFSTCINGKEKVAEGKVGFDVVDLFYVLLSHSSDV